MSPEQALQAGDALVKRIARRKVNRHDPSSQDDLEQEGRLALLQAARRFDPARGVRFTTYATPFVASAIARTARKQSLVHLPEGKWQSGQTPPAVVSLSESDAEQEEEWVSDHQLHSSSLSEEVIVTALAAREELARMKPRQRRVFLLFAAGHGEVDIARQERLSRQRVHQIILWVRRRLKLRLAL